MFYTNSFGDKTFYLPVGKSKRLIFRRARNRKWYYEGWYKTE